MDLCQRLLGHQPAHLPTERDLALAVPPAAAAPTAATTPAAARAALPAAAPSPAIAALACGILDKPD